MTVAINDHDSEYGFTFWPPRIRRMSSQKLADVEFAYEVALITDTIEGANQLILDRLEIAAQPLGLVIDYSKTKFITLKIPEEESSLLGSTENQLEKVNDFVYLRA